MSFGVTVDGFVAKSLEVIKAELEADWRSEFGASTDLDPQTPDGQIIGIMSERLAELWELAEASYAAFDPDQATGTALDALAALTGTVREPAEPSTVTATLTGTAGTVVPAGKTASVLGTGVRFDSTAPATLVALTAWQATTAYVVGDRRTNAGNVYRCTQAGTSAGSGGPTGTGTSIVDNTVRWDFLGVGTAAADAPMESELTGPKVAAARTLVVIETPVSGWQGVINILDAVLGRDVETDAAERLRREEELRAAGRATADAIRAYILKNVEGVTACGVFVNDSDVTDAEGLPPHSIEALVLGGDDQAIADAIWAVKGAGINSTNGSVTKTVTDASGESHTIKFSRPTLKPIYVDITVLVDGTTDSPWPTDGSDQVELAIVAWGSAQAVGKNSVASAVGAQAFEVPGVLDANPVYIGLAPAPVTSTTIQISMRELATYDTSRITVTVTTGTP